MSPRALRRKRCASCARLISEEMCNVDWRFCICNTFRESCGVCQLLLFQQNVSKALMIAASIRIWAAWGPHVPHFKFSFFFCVFSFLCKVLSP